VVGVVPPAQSAVGAAREKKTSVGRGRQSGDGRRRVRQDAPEGRGLIDARGDGVPGIEDQEFPVSWDNERWLALAGEIDGEGLRAIHLLARQVGEVWAPYVTGGDAECQGGAIADDQPGAPDGVR